MNERAKLIHAQGYALVFMFRADPALAGRYLDRMVDDGVYSTEQALLLMDELRANNPPVRTEGAQ